jgi:hypothetical protein
MKLNPLTSYDYRKVAQNKNLDALIKESVNNGVDFYDCSVPEVSEHMIDLFLWGSYWKGPKDGKVDILTNYQGFRLIITYIHNNRHFLELFNLKYCPEYEGAENEGVNAAVFAGNKLIGVLRNL